MPIISMTQQEYEKIQTLLHHTVSQETLLDIASLRAQYIKTALAILRGPGPSRSQSLALTQLEESLFHAIQALVLQGAPQLSLDFVVESTE